MSDGRLMRQIEPEGFGAVGRALRLVVHLVDGTFLVHGPVGEMYNARTLIVEEAGENSGRLEDL